VARVNDDDDDHRVNDIRRKTSTQKEKHLHIYGSLRWI
jgi:hypothetical protein